MPFGDNTTQACSFSFANGSSQISHSDIVWSYTSKNHTRVCGLTHAPLGGTAAPPPLEYSRLLKNYVRYRHQTFSTLSDINLTPCLKILSNLVGKFLRKWRFSDVMSCDFELKMVVSYIDRRLIYAEANRKQKVSKQRKLNSLQDGYLGFLKFDFDPQNFKKTSFSGKSALKSKISKIFKKPYYMYRTHMRVVRMPNFKFVSQFLTPKWL